METISRYQVCKYILFISFNKENIKIYQLLDCYIFLHKEILTNDTKKRMVLLKGPYVLFS